MSKFPATLIIVNQTVSPAFCQWLCTLSDTYGPIELWTGKANLGLPENIVVRFAPTYDRSNLRSRLQTWLTFTLTVIWWLIRHWSRTPIFVVTNPPLAPLVALLASKIQGRPYALLEWDIYPNILAAMKVISTRNPIYQLWYIGHRVTLRNACLVVTIGENMANELRQLAALDNLQLAVIPNWVDTQWIHPIPIDANPFSLRHNLQNKFVVLYSGNLGATHSIETILEVAKMLLDNSKIIFLIIGNGDKRHLVEEAIASGASNIYLLSWQPTEELPLSLASGQIGIVTLASGYETSSMPSKTYGLLSAGTAILGISNAPNDLAATIEGFQCGKNFSPHDVSEIVCWISSLVKDQQQLAHYQQAARLAAVEQFDGQLCMDRLTKLVAQHLLNR